MEDNESTGQTKCSPDINLLKLWLRPNAYQFSSVRLGILRNATEKTVFERSINAVNDELNTLIDALYQVEAQENGDEE